MPVAPGVLKTLQPWNRGAGHFLLHGFDPQRGNIGITLAASQGALPAGSLLGQAKAATAAVKASGANTGNGTISAVTTQTGAKKGLYAVRFTAPTAFTVEDADGDVIGTGATGAAFNDDIGFTITAGGTPFAAGDGFDITVAANGNWEKLDLAATDGTQDLAGILWDDRGDLAATQKAVAIVREATINANALPDWAGLNSNQKALIVSQAEKLRIIIQA